MKHIISLFFILIYSINMTGQASALQNDRDYKNFLNYYQKAENYMENGDAANGKKFVKNAMYYVKKLVKKGFGDDIAKQLSQLEHWQSGFDAQKSEGRKMADYESEIGNWHSQFRLLKQSTPFSSSKAIWEAMQAFDRTKVLNMIEVFKSSPAFAQSNDFIQQRTNELHQDIQNFDQVLVTVKFKEKVDKKIAELTGTHVENFFDDDIRQLGQYIEAYLQAAPHNRSLQTYHKKYNELKSNKGQILSNAQSERAKAAVMTELPVADVQDATMEADFMRVAGAASAAYQPTSAIITSRYWSVNNDITGRPISRQRIAAITYKDAVGKCYLEHILFLQDHQAGGYGRTKIYSAYGKKPYDCALGK